MDGWMNGGTERQTEKNVQSVENLPNSPMWHSARPSSNFHSTDKHTFFLTFSLSFSLSLPKISSLPPQSFHPPFFLNLFELFHTCAVFSSSYWPTGIFFLLKKKKPKNPLPPSTKSLSSFITSTLTYQSSCLQNKTPSKDTAKKTLFCQLQTSADFPSRLAFT